MQFRATCSKWNQKLTLSISARNIDEARLLLHWQGYSIMEIQEGTVANAKQEAWGENFFFFDALINWQTKSWKIQSTDVFKAYTKLVDGLGYNILSIYTIEWMNEEQKKVITAKVKDGYSLYKQSMGININQSHNQTEKENDNIGISSQVLKEINHYSTVIDSTIEKIQNLFLKYHKTITPEKRQELENIESVLSQAKWWSNLWRLKNIIENALTVVGRVESDLIKWWVEGEKDKLIEETNSLLKQIWSSERIITKEQEKADIGKNILWFFQSFKKEEVSKIEQKKKVDTNSFIFYKNLRELNVYKANLNKVVIDILKAIVLFNFSQIKRLRLKKKLLEQDIQIIDNRIHNRNISYTKIVKGTNYYIDIFFKTFQKIWDILLYSLLLYSIFYITIESLKRFWYMNYSIETRFFLFICIFSLVAFIFSFFRSILSFIIFGIVFLMIFIFLSINF